MTLNKFGNKNKLSLDKNKKELNNNCYKKTR